MVVPYTSAYFILRAAAVLPTERGKWNLTCFARINVPKKCKRGFLGSFPHAEKGFILQFISKYFNWYTQEIGQFSSFLFKLSWSQILISTSQGNGSLASDFHIKDTTRIKTLFNFHSDRLDISHKESKEDATIYSRKSPSKNTHYSFFSIESIITTTYIPQNCAPQIGTNEQTRDPIERHHDPLGKKNDLLRGK